jgi:hypothetical protein
MEVLVKPESAIDIDVRSFVESSMPGLKPPYKLQFSQPDQQCTWKNGCILPTVTIAVISMDKGPDDQQQKRVEAPFRIAQYPRFEFRLLGSALGWMRTLIAGLLGMSKVFAKRLWWAHSRSRASGDGQSFGRGVQCIDQRGWQRIPSDDEYTKCARGGCEAYLRP